MLNIYYLNSSLFFHNLFLVSTVSDDSDFTFDETVRQILGLNVNYFLMSYDLLFNLGLNICRGTQNLLMEV